MADIAHRSQYEEETAALIALLLMDDRDQLAAGLDAAGIRSGTDRLAGILGHAFSDSARGAADELGFATAGIGNASKAWSTTYSMGLLGTINVQSQQMFAGHNLSPMELGVELDKLTDPARWATLGATEVTRAASAGSEWSAALFGLTTMKTITARWTTEGDEKVCPYCAPLDGLDRDIWGNFYPSGPPAHPNCRCYLSYELD